MSTLLTPITRHLSVCDERVMLWTAVFGTITNPKNQTLSVAYFEPSISGLRFDELDPSTLTHVIYAFAGISEDGTVGWDASITSEGQLPSYWNTQRRMEKYERYCGCEGTCLKGYLNMLWKLKRENPHIRTILSVGGF